MPTFEEELNALGGGGPSFDDELAALGGGTPQVGVTLEGLDTDRAAAEQSAFKPWSGPAQIPATPSSSAGQAMWGTQNDPNADWLDKLAEGTGDGIQRGAMAATMGWGDELAGAMPEWAGGGDATRDAIRNRVQLAKERSPTASVVGDVAGAAVPAIATGLASGGAMAALPLAGRVAGGFGLAGEQGALAAAGYADDGDRWQAAKDAAPISGLMGAGGELAATGLQSAGNWMQNTAAPWLKDSGLIDRVASSGRSGPAMRQLGSRQDVINLGQFMQDEGITGLTPTRVANQAAPVAERYRGMQDQFVNDISARETPVYVDAGGVAGDLESLARENEWLAPDTNQSIASLARKKAADVLDKSQPLTEPYAPGSTPISMTPGSLEIDRGVGWGGIEDELARNTMEFPNALKQRQAFDAEVNWARDAKQPVHEQVSQTAGDSFRSGLVNSLQQQAPEMVQPWNQIQDKLGKSIDVLEPSRNKAMSDLGSSPLSFSTLAGAAGGGLPGAIAAGAIKTGGRGAMADLQRGGSAALDWLGSQGDAMGGMTQGASQMGAQHYGEQQGVKESRGYLLPQAAQQMMQQRGSLGPYEKQFFDAANSQDTNALSNLIVRLSHTDPQFRQTILPKLQQLTAEGY
jgi:hypothetical protein